MRNIREKLKEAGVDFQIVTTLEKTTLEKTKLSKRYAFSVDGCEYLIVPSVHTCSLYVMNGPSIVFDSFGIEQYGNLEHSKCLAFYLDSVLIATIELK